MEKIKNINFCVQASSVSWSGSKELAMNEVSGKPALYWTIKKIFDNFENPRVVIIAPEFDRNGKLKKILEDFKDQVEYFFGFDESPLDRLISSNAKLLDDEYIVRIDGLNFGFDPKAVKNMLESASKSKVDIIKFPDDYCIQLTFEVYRIGALKKVRTMLGKKDDIYKVHPKYYMFLKKNDFASKYLTSIPEYSNQALKALRKQYEFVFEIRQGAKNKRIAAGDMLNFHYEFALKYIKKNMKVLDIASGEGYGSAILASKAQDVTGADLDQPTIAKARKLHKSSNLNFVATSALKTGFEESCFDLITSFETIEHIEGDVKYLEEMKRILKPGGRLILSTPQNSLGHIPMNNQHKREYSLSELISLVQKTFKIEEVIGIKQGRIIFENDPVGTNTILVCRKI